MGRKKLLIVQHMAWEGPGGHLKAALGELGLDYQVAEVWHAALPALAPFAGMIVLGGSPNVDEEDRYPYLRPLKALIRETIASDRVYLGFCLGHQLLAHVLGCRVGPLPKKSVGFITGRLTPRGRVHPAFEGLPTRLELFKWHGQGVYLPIPHGLSILATSDPSPVEALGLMDNYRVLGLQFDNHADAADVETWLAHDGDWALAGSGVDPQALKAAAREQEASMGLLFRRFLENFCRSAGLL
ncbi:MAG: type 1 glutamine amidotransferase [Thermodesulfobacteriota bacterium]